jgi:type IV pilus assembly protein PilM
MSESIWKKEIRLRKPKEPKAPKQPEQVVAAAAPAPAPAPKPESFWKKERSLGKSKPPAAPKQPEPERVVAAAAPAPAPAPKSESFWKKERSLGRTREPLPPLPERLLAEHRDPTPKNTVVIPVLPPREEPKEQIDPWTAPAVLPVEPPTADEPTLTELDAVPVIPWEPEPEHAPEVAPHWSHLDRPQAEVVPSWTPQPMEHGSAPAEVEASDSVVPDRVSEVSLESSAPVESTEPEELGSVREEVEVPDPVVPNQVPEFGFEPQHVPEFAFAPAPEPTPLPELPPEVLVTPEPAAPVAEKVPLLKREIHFRKPKAAQQPKPAAAPKEKVPLLKREISLKRKPRAAKSDDAHKVTRVVGLRIGSSQLAAALVRNNGSAEVLQLARQPLERGLVMAGEVREPVALAKALKAFFADNKLPRKDIRLGIASNRIGVRMLDVPMVDDPKHFDNAIRFHAQETLPIPVADAVLDHIVLGHDASQDGSPTARVLLVFAHRELVARYVDVCKQAGLRLAGIDLDAFALLRAVAAKPEEGSRKASVAVGLGHERTVFAVSDGYVCDFTRVFEWGSGQIDIAIARALNLSPSQAEPIKHHFDLDATEPPAGLSPMQFEAAREAVKTELAALVRELFSSLRFYQSRPDSLDLSEIVLSGGGAQLPGLADEVQRGLGVPVRVADPFGNVTLGKKVAKTEDAGSLAIAVGLGIEA